MPLQDRRQLLDERVVAQLDAADLIGVAVVGDDRRNRGEQAHGGGDQRFGDARRHHGERRLLHVTEAVERIHDAPHRAEQADVGAGRADRREHRQAVLQPIALLEQRDAHAAACAFDQLRRGECRPAGACARTRGSPARKCLHALGHAPALVDGAEHRRQVAARPEHFLEAVGVGARAAQLGAFAQHDRPRHDRGEQQQRHDDLHDDAGVAAPAPADSGLAIIIQRSPALICFHSCCGSGRGR